MSCLREWWIVIGSSVRSDEIFYSYSGAESWQEDFGGEIVHVREVPNNAIS